MVSLGLDILNVIFECCIHDMGAHRVYLYALRKSVKIKVSVSWTKFYELGGSFGSELKLNQTEFPPCECGSLGEEALPCSQGQGGGEWSSQSSFLELLRCPSPHSPGTAPLQGFCLTLDYLDPKAVTMSNLVNVDFLVNCGKEAAYLF